MVRAHRAAPGVGGRARSAQALPGAFQQPPQPARGAVEPSLAGGVFETEEWQAAYTVAEKAPPPKTPPSLAERVRIVAGFGGFLNRKHDGFPGSKTLWIGLQRVQDFALALAAQQASQR